MSETINAYLVIEQGDHTVWIAPTMQRALELAWCHYVKENEYPLDEDLEGIREEYEQDVLESCSLLGEVGNP